MPIQTPDVLQISLVYWTAALAFSTIFLGIVASLQDIIRGWFWGPRLHCYMILKTPDCHLLKPYHIYYIRFRIENKGNESAKNVQVVIMNVKNKNDQHIKLSTDNLLWSTLEIEPEGLKKKMYWEYISPKTHQYCNLGYIRNPQDNNNHNETRGKHTAVFCLSVYWPTEDYNYVLDPAEYNFDVIIGCENGKTVSKKYNLLFNGLWTENESKMLVENIKIRGTDDEFKYIWKKLK